MSAQKEKRHDINDFRGSLVAGAVLLGLWPRESGNGDALLPETRTRSARIGLFIPNRLQEQVLDALEIKNPANFFAGFLVVDYMIEISNLDLLEELAKVVDIVKYNSFDYQ